MEVRVYEFGAGARELAHRDERDWTLWTTISMLQPNSTAPCIPLLRFSAPGAILDYCAPTMCIGFPSSRPSIHLLFVPWKPTQILPPTIQFTGGTPIASASVNASPRSSQRQPARRSLHLASNRPPSVQSCKGGVTTSG
ncbi:hypothetical protein Hypma_009425 [Hypsizygus marmoreus]|uniref:Uncharacterized protein n=1 Tax=Hypsizygus marmoreus TaxID=39966 RepID=A0A369JXL7_HYPMA|nr:hypothetical protein Hypma_009425 [Hypsizygus marmoreus]